MSTGEEGTGPPSLWIDLFVHSFQRVFKVAFQRLFDALVLTYWSGFIQSPLSNRLKAAGREVFARLPS